MAVVTGQVGVDQMGGNGIGFGLLATFSHKNARDKRFKLARWNRDPSSHSTRSISVR